jgi:uroporphyrin-III C-methyltransferase
MQTKAYVSIVGTGPGDPDLLTVKAVKTVGSASMLAYEKTIDPRIIDFFSPHNLPQMRVDHSDIELIVERARQFGHVAFLVSGDSCVSGDAFALQNLAGSMGVGVHVVPGVPKEIAMATKAGIPLTKRGSNESFCVMNAAEFENISRTALAALQSTATIIIRNVLDLASIVERIRTERPEAEPCAFIHRASDSKIIGTLADVHRPSYTLPPDTQSVLIVGKVVAARIYVEEDYYETDYIHK